ncbi:Uncharacterised protein [Klebsiella pneumoniae]|uniref:Uncharacterized protein n=1 Tax=Klebsiella pneumoniae TaxID=573 RepID=A0A377TWI6_KLEPN|nr:Uncharacterised protein [Klebsiella pneumoniae]
MEFPGCGVNALPGLRIADGGERVAGEAQREPEKANYASRQASASQR